MARPRLSADALLLVCVLVWSLNFAVTRYALTHGFAPLAYATLRFAVSIPVFLALVRRDRSEPLSRRAGLRVAAVGATVVLVNQVTFALSLHLGKASTVALLFGTLPIFASVLQRGRHGRRHWTAAAVSCAGVALVALGTSGGVSGDLGGVLVGILSPATIALYSVLLAPHVARSSSVRVNLVSSLGCLVPLAGAASPSLAGEHWSAIPLLAWGALAFSSIVGWVLTQAAWLVAVDRIGAARASIYVNLQPFLGAVFGVVLLSERLRAVQIAGGAVIAGGIVVARWRRPRRAALD